MEPSGAVYRRWLDAHYDGPRLLEWLVASSRGPMRDELEACCRLQRQQLQQLPVPHADQLDALVGQGDERRRAGAYYTPSELAGWVVRQVDAALVEQLQLADGLADLARWRDVASGRSGALATTSRADEGAEADEPFLRILDPALGAGVFWVAIVRAIHHRLTARWQQQRVADQERAERWDDYVVDHLLPRLIGLEKRPEACLAAHFRLAAALADTGFRFHRPGYIQAYLADTLADPAPTRSEAERARLERRTTVVVGNPPFAALSTNDGRWIRRLLKGDSGEGAPRADYFRIDGQPLGERKLWLHDDYVKFIRYAHWRIEQAGCGALGLVTSHGLLDNATFRAVRWQLSQTFPWMRIVDLHGNRRAHERAAASEGRDENVFAIDQGVAATVAVRPPAFSDSADIRYSELWGTRAKKLATLDADSQSPSVAPLGWIRLHPQAPDYRFVPRRISPAQRDEYATAIPLPEAMPVYTTAPVTARDGLVVAIEREELVERIEQLADRAVSDERIRDRLLPRSRSPRYPRGETRGWSLRAARQRLAGEADWQRYITTCYYRPFDARWVFWAEWMIDWPRPRVVRHLRQPGNLALVVRRQSPPALPCTFFWITDRIALDGLIRSDNRGSEALFPLYLHDDPARPDDTDRAAAAGRGNLAPAMIDAVCGRLGIDYAEGPAGRPCRSWSAADLLHFIYAQFHAPRYRERYRELLRSDFPRVFLPRDAERFAQLAELGRQLVDLHLQRSPLADGEQPAAAHRLAEPVWIGRGYPAHRDGRIELSRALEVQDVPQGVWEFRAGGHQVARKWLRDRRGRPLTGCQLARYAQILAALRRTLALMQSIDRLW